MMLQQTQMNTVLPYYDRWMKAFPDVRTLAAARPEKVLKLWEGLGYYSRARNLHESAQRIVNEHGGKFPSDFETIRSLKGIGPYSAGAISSIAFNEDRPIVDGNILRVLSRVFAVKDPIDVPKNREQFWRLEANLIPSGRARDFNQALMELGALVCAPQEPACALCPVRTHCRAHKEGSPDRYPIRARKKRTIRVRASAVVLSRGARYYLRLRPAGSVMGGLWEFPEWKVADKRMILSKLEQDLGIVVSTITRLGSIKRNYTNHLETLEIFKAEAPDTGLEDVWRGVWATHEEFKKYPFSSAHAKIASLLAGPAKSE